MVYVLMRQKVESIDQWKATYDSIAELRKEAGERSLRLFHPTDSQEELIQLYEWESEEHLRAFMQRMATPKMREKMSGAGALGRPEILYLKEV